MNYRARFIFTTIILTGLSLAGCSSGSGTSDGTNSEVATAAISGSSTASEGTVAYQRAIPRRSSLERLKQVFTPIPNSWAVPSCNWSSLITSCSGAGVETLSFDSCSSPDDPAIRIQGSESLAWSGAGCCTSTPLSASSTTPCSFTRRTLNSSGAVDPLVRSVGANSATLNTEDTSGYAEAKTGGFAVTCQGNGGVNTCDAQREITISGAHYTGRADSAQWDHTVSTDQPITEQGHDSGRKVLSGVIRVQNNLLQQTSVSTVTSTLTHSSGCCFPTGGSISTAYIGGKLDGKTETLTYGPGCGQATLNGTNQEQTGLTLHHCL